MEYSRNQDLSAILQISMELIYQKFGDSQVPPELIVYFYTSFS
jgi:hypothetical protein